MKLLGPYRPGCEIVDETRDLPVAEKCKFYAKAQQLYERQLPLIQGDTYTAYGKTFPLEPLQADVKKHLDAVRQKLSSSGCPANVKQ